MHKYTPHMILIGVALLIVGVLIYLVASGTVSLAAQPLHKCSVALANGSGGGSTWTNGYWYSSMSALSQATIGESPDPTDPRQGNGPICAIDYDPTNVPTAWAVQGGPVIVPSPVFFTGAQQNYFYAYTDKRV